MSKCAECGTSMRSWIHCGDCNEDYCDSRCLDEHRATCTKIRARREQGMKWHPFEEQKYQPGQWTCASCHEHKSRYDMHNHCGDCGTDFCDACWKGHRYKAHSQQGCAFCGTHESFAWSHCLGCGKSFCERAECQMRHEAMCNPSFNFFHNSNYTYEQQAFNADEMRRLFEELSREQLHTRTSGYFYGFKRESTNGTATNTSTIPREVRDALALLGLAGTPTTEQIKQAFRDKVKKAADGKGGYRGDMDKLVTAKEKALAWTGKK